MSGANLRMKSHDCLSSCHRADPLPLHILQYVKWKGSDGRVGYDTGI